MSVEANVLILTNKNELYSHLIQFAFQVENGEWEFDLFANQAYKSGINETPKEYHLDDSQICDFRNFV